MNKNDLNAVFSHKSDNWITPQWLYDRLDLIYKFTLDPASDGLNNKCSKFYTPQDNGLDQSWKNETVYINPPYSNCYGWVKKAYLEARDNNVTSVLLLPARMDTKWVHDFCFDKDIIKQRALWSTTQTNVGKYTT